LDRLGGRRHRVRRGHGTDHRGAGASAASVDRVDSAEEYDQVRRVAARGPVPADPILRQEAARFASLRYDEFTRFRVPLLIAFGLYFALAVLAAMVSSPWFWLSAVFFALLLAFQVLWPRRLRRRVERLQAEGGG
jgi:Flp pilus assembly protein TadB